MDAGGKKGEKCLHGDSPKPLSRRRGRRGRGGGELSGLLGDERVRGRTGALHARGGGGGLARQSGRTLTRHPGGIHNADAHTGDKHIYRVMCDGRKKHHEVSEGGKEKSGEKGHDTVPLYLPNAALVGEKRGKRDMRSEVMQT